MPFVEDSAVGIPVRKDALERPISAAAGTSFWAKLIVARCFSSRFGGIGSRRTRLKLSWVRGQGGMRYQEVNARLKYFSTCYAPMIDGDMGV